MVMVEVEVVVLEQVSSHQCTDDTMLHMLPNAGDVTADAESGGSDAPQTLQPPCLPLQSSLQDSCRRKYLFDLGLVNTKRIPFLKQVGVRKWCPFNI